MRKFNPLVAVCACAILFSCQKEVSNNALTNQQANNNNNGNNNNNNNGANNSASLKGNWTFVGMDIITNSQQQVSIGPANTKTVTLARYTTQDNKGDLTIDASKLSMTNITYSINTTAKAYIYENNVLQDSIDMPMQFASPPSNSTTDYKLVGTDSMSFSNATVAIAGFTSVPINSGVKYKIEGNKLILTEHGIQAFTQTIQGAQVNSRNEATSVVTFQKKQ